MSFITNDAQEAFKYADKRIEAEPELVLIAFSNGDTIIITTLDSDIPEGFSTVGTFYREDAIVGVVFKGISTIR